MSSHAEISLNQVSEFIRDVPDFPKPGITFKDITPLLGNAVAFRTVIAEMARRARPLEITQIVAIESRGFLFGSALALELGVGVAIARKPKKLPFKTTKIEYALEYGNDSLEMHTDSLRNTDRVLIVDDVLATGGTAAATARLVEMMGAKVHGLAFLMELDFLNGRKRLEGLSVHSLLRVP